MSRERPAEPGEVCTCGRPAVIVYTGGRFGDTGYCGREQPPGEPCPWCTAAGHAGRCPDYRLRPDPAVPIEREPRAVRPPYDVPDDRLAAIDAVHGTEAWRTAVRLDRVAALREPLHGLAVTEYEHRRLEWLAVEGTVTVAVLAALLHRARAAEPLPDVR